MIKTTLIVKQEHINTRLDKFILLHYPHLQNSLIQKWIRTKFIRLDGKKTEFNTRLQAGQIVEVPIEFINNFEVEDKKNTSLVVDLSKYKNIIQEVKDSILYKDDNYIIINKPAGLSVQGGSGVLFCLQSMFEQLRFELENDPQIVHRIDKDTTGILILARNKQTAQYMFEMFKNKKIAKHYVALISNIHNLKEPSGIIDKPLLKLDAINSKKVIIEQDEGKEAITHYDLISKNNNFGYINLYPKTGRTHQLRVHLSAVLHTPIVGDYKYGYSKKVIDANDSVNQNMLYLHSYKVCFDDINGNTIKLEAKLPNYFTHAIENLKL
jgi:23S rRNA pseudouridine955/2504/2580 synthase